MIISMSFLKIICKMQWIIFRRLEEAIAHREAGKYPISSDILDKTIDELKEILSAEKERGLDRKIWNKRGMDRWQQKRR